MAGTLARGELEPIRVVGPARLAAAEYSVATLNDDADLRKLLKETPMAGAVRVSFTREPHYFAHEGSLGAVDLTIVARRAGRLVCMGHCSTRHLYLDGAARRVGYLGELRMRAGEPGGMALLRGGYRFFREQAQAAPADFYFTSIAADNTRAQRVLESGGRLGLPAYRFLANLVTWVAPVSSRSKENVTTAPDGTTREELTSYLDTRAKAKNLSLPWDERTWAALARHCLSWKDFAVVRRAGRIVAAAALWDQRSFRQTVIAGYSTPLALLRPVLNAWNAVGRRPGLPAAKSVLEQAALFGLTVEDPTAWPELWSKLRAQAVRRRVRWIVWSLDAKESDQAEHRRIPGARLYRSRLYSVQWDDLPTCECSLGERSFRPEVALL